MAQVSILSDRKNPTTQAAMLPYIQGQMNCPAPSETVLYNLMMSQLPNSDQLKENGTMTENLTTLFTRPDKEKSEAPSSNKETQEKRQELRTWIIELNSTISGTMNLGSAMKAGDLLKRIYMIDLPITEKVQMTTSNLSPAAAEKISTAIRYFKNGGTARSGGGGGGGKKQAQATAQPVVMPRRPRPLPPQPPKESLGDKIRNKVKENKDKRLARKNASSKSKTPTKTPTKTAQDTNQSPVKQSTLSQLIEANQQQSRYPDMTTLINNGNSMG